MHGGLLPYWAHSTILELGDMVTVDWVFGHAKSTAGNLIVKMLVPSTFVSLEPRTMWAFKKCLLNRMTE